MYADPGSWKQHAAIFERKLALLVALQGASSWKVFFQATVRG